MSPAEAHTEAVRRIEQARAEGARLLDLGDLPLAELPKELGRLSELRVLALGDFSARPGKDGVEWDYDSSRPRKLFSSLNVLRNLVHLEHLDFVFCEGVTDLSPLAGLVVLQSLHCSYCSGVTDLSPLAGLVALQYLKCSGCNGVTDLSPLAGLVALQYLKCSGCGVTDLSPLAGLAALQSLDCSGCNGVLAGLAALQSLHYSSCSGVTDLSPLAGLVALQSLHCSGCYGVTDLSSLAGLVALRNLDCSRCDGVTDLSPLAGLVALRNLDCRSCGVTDLSPLAGLVALQILDCSYCDAVRSFGKLHKSLPSLRYINLFGCEFDDLPEEVCGESFDENVLPKVRAHYADLERGQSEDAEVKLFVLGNGGVGKTQMCRRLRRLPYDQSIATTHGVQLDHFDLNLEGRTAPVQVRFWDFGGQDVYHGTHALFLQGHAVFVVLWTPGREEGEANEGDVPIRHRPLSYWLDYLRGVAGVKSPVLVVQSQCDEPGQIQEPPQVSTKVFRYLKFLEFSARTDLGLDALIGHVKEGVRNLLAVRPLYKIGKGRVEVKAKLRALLEKDQTLPEARRRHRTLTLDKFRAICQKTGKVTNPDLLLDYLHRCGVVFHRAGLFEDRIILDQAWALEAIYTVLHRQRTLPHLRRDGRFTRQTLAHLAWQNYSVKEQETFLGMMQSCGVCFRARNLSGDENRPEWEYIAPDLLPEWSGVQDQLFGRLRDEDATAAATVRYAFLHEGILRTFLSRIGARARDAAVYWKYGCWFGEKTTNSTMLIQSRRSETDEAQVTAEIVLSAWGAGADKLIDHVLETLLRIPVGQPPTVERTAARPDRPAPDAAKSVGGVETLVMSAGSPLPAGEKKRVCLSYGHGSADAAGKERGEVADRLCERLREWKYEVLRDQDDMIQGDLLSDFMSTIGQGDRVVLVLSDKYLRSAFCMNELYEVYLHSRARKEDFVRRILPLTLADAQIGTIRERIAHARYWKSEYEELGAAVADGLLGPSDYALWLKMRLWAEQVSEILAHIADVLHPMGFEAIVADDFSAVKQRLMRGD